MSPDFIQQMKIVYNMAANEFISSQNEDYSDEDIAIALEALRSVESFIKKCEVGMTIRVDE